MVEVNVTELPLQIDVALGVIEIVGAALLLTLMVMELEVTIADVAQGKLLAKSQVTTSLLFNVVDTNVADVVPVETPFTFQS